MARPKFVTVEDFFGPPVCTAASIFAGRDPDRLSGIVARYRRHHDRPGYRRGGLGVAILPHSDQHVAVGRGCREIPISGAQAERHSLSHG